MLSMLEEIKQQKTKEYEELKAKVELEKIAREPDLLSKLDDIAGRVVASRSMKPIDNEEAWSVGGGALGEKPSALSGM